MPQTKVQEQRTFIHGAFYPSGAEACAAVGLAPESEEVAEAETDAVRRWLGDPRFYNDRVRAVRMAEWYAQVAVDLKAKRTGETLTDEERFEQITAHVQTFLIVWRGISYMQEA